MRERRIRKFDFNFRGRELQGEVQLFARRRQGRKFLRVIRKAFADLEDEPAGRDRLVAEHEHPLSRQRLAGRLVVDEHPGDGQCRPFVAGLRLDAHAVAEKQPFRGRETEAVLTQLADGAAKLPRRAERIMRNQGVAGLLCVEAERPFAAAPLRKHVARLSETFRKFVRRCVEQHPVGADRLLHIVRLLQPPFDLQRFDAEFAQLRQQLDRAEVLR